MDPIWILYFKEGQMTKFNCYRIDGGPHYSPWGGWDKEEWRWGFQCGGPYLQGYLRRELARGRYDSSPQFKRGRQWRYCLYSHWKVERPVQIVLVLPRKKLEPDFINDEIVEVLDWEATQIYFKFL
jgi:hypothetical protein